jgi:hypothetical protein
LQALPSDALVTSMAKRKKKRRAPLGAADQLDPVGDEGHVYDPMLGPDPELWLAFDERARMDMVREHHLSHRASHDAPDALEAHCAAHVLAENQIALAEPLEIVDALERLLAEGIDRHHAIHAIAQIAAQHIFDSLGAEAPNARGNLADVLAHLDVEAWRHIHDRETSEGLGAGSRHPR